MSVVTYLATGWEFVETPKAKLHPMEQAGKVDWLPAQVPGYVHLDLIANGVIEHPFYRMNEAGCQWVDTTDWTYRTTFTWQPTEGTSVRHLHFPELDTVCDVYLNGDKIASHDNAFLPLTVEVSGLLKEGENTLQINFKSAVNVGNDRMKAYFDKHGLHNTSANFYDRSFVRKAQYMFGWDWGPRLVSCGITAPVSLLESNGEPEIADVHVTQTHHEDHSVTVHLKVETTKPLNGLTLEASLADEEHYRDLEFTQESDTVFKAELTLQDPILWDTDYPYLYDLSVELYGENDELFDDYEASIGLRTIELIQEPDEHGQSYYFKLNGNPIYAMGANWIPNHSFPATVTEEQYRQKIEAAKDMGMNMLRIWGGGIYETETFYDICDELGILVWQDFTYGCNYVPDDEEHQVIAKNEAAYQIKRLRNRASLAIWCGNNENQTMFDSKWGGEENNPPRHYGENIYHKALQEACDELDPSRPYVPSSPYGKDKKLATPDGVDHYNHNMGRIGDSHYWDVWHGRGDWKYYADSTTRFSSEFGFASAPSMEVFEEFISPRAFQPFSHEVNWHNKTRKPIEMFTDMVYLHYPQIKTVEDLTYYTQLNQRDAMKFGIEHWRRSEFCKGTLIWQLNDCWPVQSWALLDNFGNWKAAAHELVRLYDPVTVSVHKTDAGMEVWGINDDPTGQGSETLETYFVDLKTGDLLDPQEHEFDWSEPKREKITTVETKGYEPNSTLFITEFGDHTAWQLLGEPKDVEIKPANITIGVISDTQIMLQTDGPVVDLWLRDPDDGVQFGLNFITSGTPGTWLIQTDGPVDRIIARSLAGYHQIEYTNSPL